MPCLRSALTVLSVMLLLVACAAPEPLSTNQKLRSMIDPDRSPAENLHRLATHEQNIGLAERRAVPMPPGVDPDALKPRSESDERAWLSLQEVLSRHAGEGEFESDHEASDSISPPRRDVETDASEDAASHAALRHYVRGRQAAMEGQYLVAMTELRRAVELDETSPTILRELARCYLAINNQTRAMETYEQLLALDSNDDEARFSLAIAAANQRDMARAIELLSPGILREDSFDHDPAADVIAMFTLAFALQQLGYDRAFIEAVERLRDIPGEMFDQTMYAARLGSVYRQRAEIWRSAGDARCRLGEYEAALDSYSRSADLPAPDPAALHPRVIYANLILGRVYTAQYELLTALQAVDRQISDRDIRLCGYIAEIVPERELLAEAVAEMYRRTPDQPDLVRAAALLAPPEQARALLRDFLDRRPRDLNVVSQLLTWLGPRDLPAAVELTVALARHHPDLAGRYAARLFFALAEPARILTVLRELPEAPEAVNIHARLLATMGAFGESWQLTEEARRRWPEDPGLVMLRLELVTLLEEPALMREISREADAFDQSWMWSTRARVHRSLEQIDEAMDAAERALDRVTDPHHEPEALLELALTYAAYAATLDDPGVRKRWAEEAAHTAEQVLQLDADADDAFELLLSIYGPSGVLSDPQQFRRTAQRLYDQDPESRLYARVAAEESITQGRYNQALERLLNLYDSDPFDTYALSLAVTAWTRSDRLDAARQWLTERLQQRPGDPALLEQWVSVMVRKGREDDVIRALNDAIEHNEDNYTARRLLESAYRHTGQMDKAFRFGEERLLSRPRGVRRDVELAALYGGVGMEREAIERIAWVRDNIADASYEHLLTAVAILGRLERPVPRRDEVTYDIVQHIVKELNPGAPLQVYGAGLRALARQGRNQEAFDDLIYLAARYAQQAGPSLQHALSWRNFAQALIEENMPAAAAAALRGRVLADVPLDPDALSFLTNAAIVAGAVAPDSDDEAEHVIVLVNQLELQSRLTRIFGMDQPPTVPRVLYQASLHFTLLNNEAGAERLLRYVIGLSPDNAMALNNLGYMRIEAGHADEQTARWIERAHELMLEDPSILDTIGWLRYKQGIFADGPDGPGALGLILESAERSPEPNAEVLDHLGDVYWRLGDREAARKAWEQAEQALADPSHRATTVRNLELLQTRGWGLLVADPGALYDVHYGRQLDAVRKKLRALRDDGEPEIAPTFDELAERD